MEQIKPTTIEDHLRLVEAVKVEAEALPAGAFGDPDMPVKIFLDEIRTALLAAREHFDALSAVG